jgi:hypothetical protein
LDRNVTIRSENAAGTRGHVLFSGRADVDIRYARFSQLGRTDAFLNLDNTQMGDDGPTHLGTNQVGRYALHIHHVSGPVAGQGDGYQFRLIGNTVDHARRWGYAVHGTSFGLVRDNVAYQVQGAGFITEDGSEIENDFIRNFALGMQGTGRDGKTGTKDGDYARGGVGFWARRTGNNFEGNVAANSTYAGFVITSYYQDFVTVAAYPGAVPSEPAQGITLRTNPPGMFQDNETYGLTPIGIWAAWPSGMSIAGMDQPIVFQNSRIWHVHRQGVVIYHTNHINLDGMQILFDASASMDFDDRLMEGLRRHTVGVDALAYENDNLIIQNSRITGGLVGIQMASANGGGMENGTPAIIRDTLLDNYVDVQVRPTSSPRGKGLEVRHVSFGRQEIPPIPDGPLPYDIQMLHGDASVFTLDRVHVHDYNRVAGDDFEVFYSQQSPETQLPVGERPAGVPPDATLSNEAAWEAYGAALGGQVAWSGSRRQGIDGLVHAGVAEAPVFVDVAMEEIGSDSAMLVIETREPTSVLITYFPRNQVEGQVRITPWTPQRQSHRLHLDDLAEDQRYDVIIKAWNAVTNEVSVHQMTLRT